FSSRRRHTRFSRDWSSDVCSSDLEKIDLLARTQEIIIGDPENFEVTGADAKKGAFLPPVVFYNDKPLTHTDCHQIEAFGPVSTRSEERRVGKECISLSS